MVRTMPLARVRQSPIDELLTFLRKEKPKRKRAKRGTVLKRIYRSYSDRH